MILVLLFVALGALIALPITSYYHFTESRPDYGGSYTEGLVGAPKFINPLLSQASDVDRDLVRIIYSGLMKYDSSGKLTYDLAESYEISADGLIYTFKLKDNLTWHDGQPVTADDIVFTILTTQNPDYGSNQRINWLSVEINKIDDLTVNFKLKNKYSLFLSNTTLGIIPKHAWEKIKPSSFGLSELNLKPIGSGPFLFSKIKKDSNGIISAMELESFDGYYAGRPFLDKLVFKFYSTEDAMIKAFNNSDVDGLGYLTPAKRNSIRFPGKLEIKELKLPRYFAIFFNQNQSKVLSDKNVRLALNYATDKNEILRSNQYEDGVVVDSPMLPGIIDMESPSTIYSFDLEKANQILEQAGWVYPNETGAESIRQKKAETKKTTSKTKTSENPAEPTKLEIKITTSNLAELANTANILKTQWGKIGARVIVEVLSLSELQQAIKDREYESLLFGEVLGLDPDPFSFWHSSQKRDPGLNLALYDNKDVDKLLEDARQTLDQSKRLFEYANFQKILIADTPAVFLYSPSYLYPQNQNLVANISSIISIPSERFNTVNQWYTDTERKFIRNED